MNKALHAFVYLFLIGVGVALWYEYQLNDKRTELKDRNRMMENYLVDQIAPLVEAGDDYDSKDQAPTIELDDDDPTDPTKIDPTKVDVLADAKGYDFAYENLVHNPLRWSDEQRNALRQVYVLDEEGKPQMDGTEKLTRNSREDEVLSKLVTSLKSQKEQLQKTREALPPLREKLKEVVDKYNEVAPKLRETVKLANDRKAEIESLEKTLSETSKERDKYKNESKEKDLEISSLRDETENLKNEIEEQKEAIEKSNKVADALKKQIQTLLSQISAATGGTKTEAGQAISSMPFGDKGKVIKADNEYMFAIVELTPEAMKQLKGDDMNRPIPMLELGVKRPGFDGPAGEFVGRIRLRQEVAGKNYVKCDILSNWSQSDEGIKANDIVFAEQ